MIAGNESKYFECTIPACHVGQHIGLRAREQHFSSTSAYDKQHEKRENCIRKQCMLDRGRNRTFSSYLIVQRQ